MTTTYLAIIGVIAVVYMVVMYVIRNLLLRNRREKNNDAVNESTYEGDENVDSTPLEGVAIGASVHEAMKCYMEIMIEGFNPDDFQLVWASTFGNTDIERIVAYNDRQILVIPAKAMNGMLVMPENQPSAAIDLSEVDHIHFSRKVSWARIMFVTLFFDPKDEKNNFDIWGTKKDPCGNDNNPNFVKFVDFMEQWAKEHNVKSELIK
ncbi:MAG: hypothetical protein J1F40_06420 [Prevotellaceae bacterium]|nr:hypothetical protein [Prevotellaceae bacterium]